MNPKHNNPQKMRRHILDKDNQDFIDVKARAPYNFVPLPDEMLKAPLPLPSMGIYSKETLTGWIECEIETCSPTYIRGMMTQKEYEALGQKHSDDLLDDEKNARAPFYSLEKSEEEAASEKKGFPTPSLPGSSLRGMVRTLVEVAAQGRMRWVAASPTFTYRAFATEGHDPLKAPYKDFMGSNASNVRVGYLEKENDRWYIRPAKTPKQCDIEGGRAERYYLKVDDEDLTSNSVPGFVGMASKDYKPQVHPVWFQKGPQKPKRPEVLRKARKQVSPTRPSWIVQAQPATGFKQGVLVCTGNMRETGDASQESPRSKHYIIMPANSQADRIPIPEQVVEDYRAGLTTYQQGNLDAWGGREWGCLAKGKPVFYVADNSDTPKSIRFLGHNPNFRIPAILFGDSRASTPLDFVPENVRLNQNPDFADAIFGWVEEESWGPDGQQAGRVFFEDAPLIFVGADGLWYKDEPITPKLLSGPKATTIQHSLVQDTAKKHDPDVRDALAHYGTSTEETAIRGHKFYWHKGAKPEIVADPENVKEHPKQYTRIVPLNSGVRFKARIRYENLREQELGALLWALTLPGEPGHTYRHKLGMGKPLGMGAIALSNLQVCSSDLHGEKSRYAALFDASHNTWHVPAIEMDSQHYICEFEKYILPQIDPAKEHLVEVDRVRMLLTMLEWRGESPDKEWLELTRYMEIEHEEQHKGKSVKYNEYKSRPVLPTPFGVWSMLSPSQPDAEEFNKAESKPASRSQSAHISGAKKTGVVKWFREGNYGYHGYIIPDDGSEEVHVDEKNLVDRSHGLKPGQKVRFSIWFNRKKKPCAENVEVIS